MEQTRTGYVLRSSQEPVAIMHAYADHSMFSHVTDQGSLPEGLVLAECAHYGAAWGILSTQRRVRLFQADPPVGSATGRYLELDLKTLGPDDKPYAALLAPDCLRRGGRLQAWIEEARSYGQELREGIEQRLRFEALPMIAKGLGD